MEAIITKIELKKFMKKYYFSLELRDSNGNAYVIDKPFCNDEIQFRRMVFGIMTACNQYDLLRLASDSPIYKEVKGYYNNGLEILENEGNEWFLYNKKTGTYFCGQAVQSIKDLYKIASERNAFDVFIKNGKIESITSGSGVFQMFFNANSVGTFLNTGQIYYGFGEPIGIGDPNNQESVRMATNAFQSFIISIMKFYSVNDLLELSGNVNKYPLVDITVDKKKVTSITSLETGMGFLIGKDYQFINVKNMEFSKKLN